MENRKELIAAMLASATNTLEEILATGESENGELNISDSTGIMMDMFTFARIYLAMHHGRIDILDEEDLAYLNKVEAYAFTHGGIDPISEITS